MNPIPDTPKPKTPKLDDDEKSIKTEPELGDPLTPAEFAESQNARSKDVWKAVVVLASIMSKRDGKQPSD